MVFESIKPDKTCSHCGKVVKNMTHHYIKNHPSVVAKIEDSPITKEEDYSNTPPQQVNSSNGITQNSYRGSNFREILNEKLDQLLSIKVIQMLEKGASIQDIQTMINPPQNKQSMLEELKAYKELFVNQHNPMPINVSVPTETSSTDWGQIINTGLQVLPELLKNRQKNEVIENVSNRTNQDGNIQNSRPISEETSRDTTESSILSEEPRIIIPTEQQNS